MGRQVMLLLAVVQLLACQSSAEMLLPSMMSEGSGDDSMIFSIETMTVSAQTMSTTIISVSGPSIQTTEGPSILPSSTELSTLSSRMENSTIMPTPSSTEEGSGEETMMIDETSSIKLNMSTVTPSPTPEATSSMIASETPSLNATSSVIINATISSLIILVGETPSLNTTSSVIINATTTSLTMQVSETPSVNATSSMISTTSLTMQVSVTPTPTDITSSTVMDILTSSSVVVQPSSTVAPPSSTIMPSATPTVPRTQIPLHLEFINLTNPILLRKGSDATSGTILIDNTGFPTFNRGVPHTRVFVSDNGVISFDSIFFNYIPFLFPTNNVFTRQGFLVAPFWSDVDTRINGSVQYQVFDPLSDNATISEVSSYVSQATNSTFNGVWMLVAEWRDVHPYPHGSTFFRNFGSTFSQTLSNFTENINTFQGVIITDGSRSYAVFLYKCGSLQWSGLDGFYDHAVIGYNLNGRFMNHPLSGTSAVRNVACANSPATPWSTLLYQIGDLEDQLQRARVNCIRRYEADVEMFRSSLPSGAPCPCSEFQAFLDRRYWFDFSRSIFAFPSSVYCYSRLFSISSGQGQLCCYDFSFGTVRFGALITEGRNPSSATAYHWRFSRQLYLEHDVAFHNACCRQADRCDLFRERRPSDNCDRYIPPRRAWFWGDPHINTLDSRMYTFNGRGEYTLVQLGDQFEFQGRTEPATMNTTATQFSACAMASPANGTKVEIQLVDAALVVLVDGSDVTADLQATNDSLLFGGNTVSVNQTSNNTVAVTFMTEITVEVTVQVGLLSFVVVLPEQFMMQARGLLGNFDGNSTNEFVFRNGTMIPDNSRDREIHNFGQSWQITDSMSLFTYPGNTGVSNFSFPDHMPVFLDELSAEAIADARRVCGNDSQCIYDFSQTGNEELAMVTMTTNEVNIMDVTISSNQPPRLNGSDVFMVTIGQPSVYQFTASDTDNFTLSVTSGGLPNTLVNVGSDMYTFTINASAVFNSTVSFAARDTLNASSLLDPQVLVCACNSGNCTLEGLLDRDSDPLIMNCLCSEAYTGRFCEEDVDGCSEITCFEGVQCTDNPAPQIGATCGPCPSGLQGDGTKCIDVDECMTDMDNCQQECVNTEGGFMCACRMGFELSNTTHCRDINECSINSDNCDQLCTNTEGGFNCSCNDGFILQSDMRSCNIDPDRNCSADNVCQQLCVRNINTTTNTSTNTSATEVCLCRNGFSLDADMRTCNDINECSSNTTNPCTQNCINGVGNFTCSCTNGYRLLGDGFTCQDINECEQAAMNSMQICNATLQCMNLIGSFVCQCPPGSELNSQGVCIAIMEPTTTTVAPMSSTVITMPSTTPVISITPPPGRDRNEVLIILTSHTSQSFTESLRETFLTTTAAALTRYCRANAQLCGEIFNRKRDVSERQTVTVQPSDIIITSVMDSPEGLRIQFYVRGMTGGVINQNDVVEALRSNNDLYRDAGFTIASVTAVGAPPDLSAGVIAGIVVGGMVAILLILLILLLLMFCCWKMCHKNQGGKYEFAKQKSSAQFTTATSGEVVIQNAAFDAEQNYYTSEKMRERDDVSVQSVTLKFGGDSSDEEDVSSNSRQGANGVKNNHDEKETFL